jgi:peptidyl-prolyl cis-trans isomerase B (cyclophilin B)
MKNLSWKTPPEMAVDVDKRYRAVIAVEKGEIEIELAVEYAPVTVNNFVFLTRQGYFDGVAFHRVIEDFVVQGGDPTGTGRGGPGYTFGDEVKNNPLKHERGVISMANAGPGTNGSQFFITHSPQPHLNGKHTVFGRVTRGMELVDALAQGDVMKSVVILES